MRRLKKGTLVEWRWGRGHAEGKVEEVFEDTVTRTIKGKKITRHGSKQTPAYLLKQANGNRVLKLQSELYVSESKHGWV